MDGDNKIDCEVCAQKKATVRRTCLGALPNMLILHLKRFDLDYTTFETVKLNNRMAFDLNINLLKYSKDGMEMEERKAEAARNVDNDDEERRDHENSSADVNYDKSEDYVEPEADDYSYELQGMTF
jgi:ubiquitin carboxyl-terminal hydrolase 9/24